MLAEHNFSLCECPPLTTAVQLTEHADDETRANNKTQLESIFRRNSAIVDFSHLRVELVELFFGLAASALPPYVLERVAISALPLMAHVPHFKRIQVLIACQAFANRVLS